MTTVFKDDNFEAEVLGSGVPVLVDFWAEWCGPCKAMSPIVDAVGIELDGKIKIGKLNIDENPHAPTKYGVRGIPTFMVFKDGRLVDTKVGSMSKDQLTSWLGGHMPQSDKPASNEGWMPVTSSNVSRVKYEDATHTLQVEFKTGAVWAYADVSRNTFNSLLAADSIGKFLNTDIKPAHPAVQVKS